MKYVSLLALAATAFATTACTVKTERTVVERPTTAPASSTTVVYTDPAPAPSSSSTVVYVPR